MANLVSVPMRFDPEQLDRVREIARKERRPLAQLLRLLLEEALEARGVRQEER